LENVRLKFSILIWILECSVFRSFSFSLFSGKYNRGRKRDGVWVFGGVDRETDECFMVPVPDRKADTLIPIIKKFIRPGSTIYSDFWKAYDCLSLELTIRKRSFTFEVKLLFDKAV
jgi:ISXO2-like transposase domain